MGDGIRMNRELGLIALITVLALAAAERGISRAQAALTQADIEQAVQGAIMARHPNDSADWWRSLGDAAPSVIMKLYLAEGSVYRKMRLMEGLGAFTDDPAAVEFIKQQGESAGPGDDVLRNNAIRVIGMNQGSREETWLGKFLEHDDANTRVAAAKALHGGSPAARSRVDRMLASESKPWVVAKVRGEAASGPPPREAASSEQRLSADMAGSWTGFWLAARPDGALGSEGMESLAVSGSVTVTGLIEVSGVFEVKGVPGATGDRGKSRTLKLERATGKGTHFKGELAVLGKEERFAVEGELLHPNRPDAFLLHLRLLESGGVIAMKRKK